MVGSTVPNAERGTRSVMPVCTVRRSWCGLLAMHDTRWRRSNVAWCKPVLKRLCEGKSADFHARHLARLHLRRRRLSNKVCVPSRSSLSRTSSLARISLLTGWCVVLTGRGESGRQAKVEILDKLRATHRRLSLEADLRVATGATPCAADGPSAPFGARANAAAQGRAACGREGAFATAHVRVARVLRMGLVGRPVDQHSASPCASVCLLLALSRGGAGVVQCNTFGPVCRVHGRVSDCVGVHV